MHEPQSKQQRTRSHVLSEDEVALLSPSVPSTVIDAKELLKVCPFGTAAHLGMKTKDI